MKSSTRTKLGLAALGIGATAFILWTRSTSPEPHRDTRQRAAVTRVTLSDEPEPVAARPIPSPERRTHPALARRPPRDESSLMAELGALGSSAPERSIELAREGNERFPNTPNAPHRAWIIAKSLTSLGHFHEAQDQARLMVARYPTAPQTRDVKRHLLVYPLDQPSREEMQQQ